MTDPEFVEWMVGHCLLFPDVKAWLMGMSEDVRRAIQEAWREALRDVALTDAKAVTQAIIAGDVPPIQAFEREYTAARVRAAAKEIAATRRAAEAEHKRQNRRPEPKYRSQPGEGPGAGEMFAEITRLIDGGMDPRAAADQVIPKVHCLDGPRFDCPLCFDSGIVYVWSERSMQAAREGKLDSPVERRAMGVPCPCPSGRHFVWEGTTSPPKGFAGWTTTMAFYQHDRYCLCPSSDVNNPHHIEALKDWVAVKILKMEQAKANTPSAVFSNWNNGGQSQATQPKATPSMLTENAIPENAGDAWEG